MKMNINIKLLTENAKIPTQGTPGSAGYDLYVTSKEKKGEKTLYHFGIAMAIPAGYAGFIFPRSSVYKKRQRLSNAVGVIDSDYRGEIQAIFDPSNFTPSVGEYEVGDRAAQMVIMAVNEIEWQEVNDELSTTARGSGGFGSTNKSKRNVKAKKA